MNSAIVQGFLGYFSHGNEKRRLIALVVGVLGVAFLLTAILSYAVSRERMHDLIVSRELPLTSDTVYSEIQRDFLRPIQASEQMASDTFLRDWALTGEKNVDAIQKYLAEQQRINSAFTTYFVSGLTHRYYIPGGLHKTVSTEDSHDGWFFGLVHSDAPYVIQVDTDQNNNNALTVFINFRVFDYQKRFIGITGMGLNVDVVKQVLDRYQNQFGRKVYFVDREGKVMMWGGGEAPFTDIKTAAGLSELADKIIKGQQGSLEYTVDGDTHLLNVRYIPELNWYLFVERIEDVALENIRRTLYFNLLIAAFATAIVAFIIAGAVNRFHAELDKYATTDSLTGLTNRRAFDILFRQAVRSGRRGELKLSLVLFDIDHFKRINDQFGHLSGDAVIKRVTSLIAGRCRASDIACRWGGEEILVLLQDCGLERAQLIADTIRQEIARTHIDVGGHPLPVTISAGVAEMLVAETEEAVLARADQALYAAKNGGRNRVVAFDHQSAAVTDPRQAQNNTAG